MQQQYHHQMARPALYIVPPPVPEPAHRKPLPPLARFSCQALGCLCLALTLTLALSDQPVWQALLLAIGTAECFSLGEG